VERTVERADDRDGNVGQAKSDRASSPGVAYWALLPITRVFDYRGRSRRKEYWAFNAVAVLTFILIVALRLAAEKQGGTTFAVMTLVWIPLAVLVLPATFAAQIRRWHDQDVTGWACLISLIPYLGGIAVLIFMCKRGTAGPNRFGSDPTEPGWRP
jgi:uncharacterized membrane protein YhaH (DUF805 family)